MKIEKYNLHHLARYASVGTAAAALVFSLASCDVKKTEDGKAPKVTVEDGKLPKYDVETAKVDITAQKKEITVPKVTTEQKTISVPDVNVTMPGDKPVTGSPAPDAAATATVTPAP
ncbi:MAG: hypothetical protein ABI839_08055 [Verrucomicrobiota bacterium]